MERDELFMRRALELAANGLGTVSPNPMVGCVIVYENKIIGEGWHKRYGEAHAEVNAIDSVEDKSLLPLSTLYVNLEPCAHYGKTPPCAHLIARYKLKAVKIANADTNPLVGGKGMAYLKDNGVAVTSGILKDEGRFLNRRFFTDMQERRPYIILKWAQTADGFIAGKNFEAKWISGRESRKLVHKWRAEEAGIMVGKNTALYDNPRLNARDWCGTNPVRVVVDRRLELPKSQALFDGSVRTICYNLKESRNDSKTALVKVSADYLLADILRDLHNKGIRSVIVEGGASLHNAFIEEDLWDEARIFINPQQFKEGIAAAKITLPDSYHMVGQDKLFAFRRNL